MSFVIYIFEISADQPQSERRSKVSPLLVCLRSARSNAGPPAAHKTAGRSGNEVGAVRLPTRQWLSEIMIAGIDTYGIPPYTQHGLIVLIKVLLYSIRACFS